MKYLIVLLTLFSINVVASPININKADAQTISQSLKGVGLIKAEEIVKYRKKNGAFKNIDELMNVKGIGEKTIKNIAKDVRFSKLKVSKKTKKAKKLKKETQVSKTNESTKQKKQKKSK